MHKDTFLTTESLLRASLFHANGVFKLPHPSTWVRLRWSPCGVPLRRGPGHVDTRLLLEEEIGSSSPPTKKKKKIWRGGHVEEDYCWLFLEYEN